MKEKLRDYIDTIFADAPLTQRVAELKEEMLQNLYEKFDDLVASGKSEAAAFNAVIAGVGDISKLIDETANSAKTEYVGNEPQTTYTVPNSLSAQNAYEKPLTVEEKESIRKYKNRSALMISIAVALYILCVVPVIICENIVGVVLMFVMIAVATCMIIFSSMSKPEALTRTAHPGHMDDENDKASHNPVFKAVSGALWTLTVCVYLVVSFKTCAWGITWLIFLISAAIENIIKAIFEVKG